MRNWLRKLQIKGFMAGVLVTAMLSGTLLVAANPAIVEMLTVHRGVNIVINGTEWNPPSDMIPFITGGRTYLPARGIAEVLGVPVEWHGPTSTVYIGAIPHGAPFFQTVTHFQSGGVAHGIGTVNMLGNAYPNTLRSNNRAAGGGSAGFWRDYNLNSQFNTITGTIGRIDGDNTAASTISFIGDGRTLATFTVDGNTHPMDISVDVRGVLILRIQVQQPGAFHVVNRGAYLAFTNAMIE